MNILKDLVELRNANVITEETYNRILAYYDYKSKNNPNRLILVFAVLGAILTGLGIILIIAHNWDEYSKTTKTIFAFLPLIFSQVLCGYVLIKKADKAQWTNSSAILLFFSIAAAISLIAQIYNIPGNLGSFVFTWMLLVFPLIYIMRSQLCSLLFIVGITFHCIYTGFGSENTEQYFYWGFLLLVLPNYYLLLKRSPNSNIFNLHNWKLSLSVLICLATLAETNEELLFNAYIFLFAIFYQIGQLDLFNSERIRNNIFQLLGSLGTIAVLLILSFSDLWEGIRRDFDDDFKTRAGNFISQELIVSTILFAIALYIFIQNRRKFPDKKVKAIEWVFLIFPMIYVIGLFSPFAAVLINLLVLFISIKIILLGSEKDHLGILNYGLLIITSLVVCRFFDSDLSFVFRGLLFLIVGIGFFACNYWIIKRRKINE